MASKRKSCYVFDMHSTFSLGGRVGRVGGRCPDLWAACAGAAGVRRALDIMLHLFALGSFLSLLPSATKCDFAHEIDLVNSLRNQNSTHIHLVPRTTLWICGLKF